MTYGGKRQLPGVQSNALFGVFLSTLYVRSEKETPRACAKIRSKIRGRINPNTNPTIIEITTPKLKFFPQKYQNRNPVRIEQTKNSVMANFIIPSER